MRFSGRFLAENEGEDGICKLLLDKKNQRIIGVHLIGNYASEIIYSAGIMIETIVQLLDLKKLVFPHPSVSEIIREALFRF
jgi:dihydrolipoamide dehydrogenase